MRRRQGFTLVELLVTMALIIFIMVILAEVLGSALNTFHQLKAIGDMQEKLRGVTTILRRDLAADHFEGRRRVRDGNFDGDLPLKGFFRLYRRVNFGGPFDEGQDYDGIRSFRSLGDVLHFSVKLRGNGREDQFVAPIPTGSPLSVGNPTNFFGQPPDALYWDDISPTYRSQWAEVAYFCDPLPGLTTGALPLYALYRVQFLVVPNVENLGQATATAGHEHISYDPVSRRFNSPEDIVNPNRRTFNPTLGEPSRDPRVAQVATLLLTDVLSFHVQTFDAADRGFKDENFDTNSNNTCKGLKVTIRVWDVKTRQSRQVTIIQDL